MLAFSFQPKPGPSHVGGNNVNNEWLKNTIKRKLTDQFQQIWQEELDNKTIYYNYRTFKAEIKLEEYLLQQPYKITKTLSRFCCSNHRLPVETDN